MNPHAFTFAGCALQALGSGALWWPEESLLCVSDLHLGKAERMLRRGGAALPPYETRDTLTRLAADLERTGARQVICLGDSFDDSAAACALAEEDRLWIAGLQAGRAWVWIEGNHDPGPVDIGGAHRSELRMGPLTFRHIAQEDASGEVSGVEMPELVARCRAVLRRPGDRSGTTLCLGHLALDTVARSASVAGVPVPLGRREVTVLEHLMRASGRVASRRALEEAVYGFDDEVGPNALEASVSRLRRALEAAGCPTPIVTVRGIGWMLPRDDCR